MKSGPGIKSKKDISTCRVQDNSPP